MMGTNRESALDYLKAILKDEISELCNTFEMWAQPNISEIYKVVVTINPFNSYILFKLVTLRDVNVFGAEVAIFKSYTGDLMLEPLGGMGPFNLEKDLARPEAIKLQSWVLENYKLIFKTYKESRIHDLIKEFREIK